MSATGTFVLGVSRVGSVTVGTTGLGEPLSTVGSVTVGATGTVVDVVGAAGLVEPVAWEFANATKEAARIV